jgi:hypothetical protein
VCTSRLRQRPTARRLHHAWWFLRSRPASCATSATRWRGPQPRPEDRSNRQVTRTLRRTRALLRRSLDEELAPRERRTATINTGPAGDPRPPRPPDPGRCTAALPRRVAASVAECGARRDRMGIPVRLRDDAAFALGFSAAPQLVRPGANALTSAPGRRICGYPLPPDRGLHDFPTPTLAKTPTVIQHAHGRPGAGLELLREFRRKDHPRTNRS